MEPAGSMLHSQELSNNPYPEPNHVQWKLGFETNRLVGPVLLIYEKNSRLHPGSNPAIGENFSRKWTQDLDDIFEGYQSGSRFLKT